MFHIPTVLSRIPECFVFIYIFFRFFLILLSLSIRHGFAWLCHSSNSKKNFHTRHFVAWLVTCLADQFIQNKWNINKTNSFLPLVSPRPSSIIFISFYCESVMGLIRDDYLHSTSEKRPLDTTFTSMNVKIYSTVSKFQVLMLSHFDEGLIILFYF